MSKDFWKKNKAEGEMLIYEQKMVDKAKEEFRKRKLSRDLFMELREMGLSSEKCDSVLQWVNTLPIEITGENHTVRIINGIIKVSNTNNE